MTAPAEVLIDVFIPSSTEIETVATTVDIAPDPGGGLVILVPSPGPPGPAGPPGDGAPVYDETPSGTKNGSNTMFTLAATPRTGSAVLYRNGLRERSGVGYTVSGSTITFSTPPLSSDDITVDYLMEG